MKVFVVYMQKNWLKVLGTILVLCVTGLVLYMLYLNSNALTKTVQLSRVKRVEKDVRYTTQRVDELEKTRATIESLSAEVTARREADDDAKNRLDAEAKVRIAADDAIIKRLAANEKAIKARVTTEQLDGRLNAQKQDLLTATDQKINDKAKAITGQPSWAYGERSPTQEEMQPYIKEAGPDGKYKVMFLGDTKPLYTKYTPYVFYPTDSKVNGQFREGYVCITMDDAVAGMKTYKSPIREWFSIEPSDGPVEQPKPAATQTSPTTPQVNANTPTKVTSMQPDPFGPSQQVAVTPDPQGQAKAAAPNDGFKLVHLTNEQYGLFEGTDKEVCFVYFYRLIDPSSGLMKPERVTIPKGSGWLERSQDRNDIRFKDCGETVIMLTDVSGLIYSPVFIPEKEEEMQSYAESMRKTAQQPTARRGWQGR